MSQLLKSAGALGAATLTSRILGLVREQVYAYFMGTTPVAGAFKLAYQIPNLFRRLLGEGALTAAFVPIFKDREAHAGPAEMWRAANAVFSGLTIVAGAVAAIAMLAITVTLWLTQPTVLADGSAAFPLITLKPDTALMLRLLRLMFPYLLLVCLAALCMGILNARGHFFVPALGAAMLNVVMIASVLLLAPRFGSTLEQQIFALGLGVLAAGFVQFVFQLPLLWHEGFRFRWVNPFGNETVRAVVRKMIPGIVGVAAFQLNVVIIQGLSFWYDGTIVAAFDTAVRLMEFPQGVVGISLATYLLTTLSGLAARKDYEAFRSALLDGLGYLVFVNLFAATLLFVLAEPIVRLLFQYGTFDRISTRQVASAVLCLAPGLVAFSGVNILARAFYALGDTKTPMRISIACLVINLLISVWVVGHFRQAGLAAANSATSFINLWLLARALRRKLPRLQFAALQSVAFPAAAAAAAAGIVAWVAHRLWEEHVGEVGVSQRLGAVFVPLLLAASVYLGLALWLKLPQAREIAGLVRRRSQRPPDDPARN